MAKHNVSRTMSTQHPDNVRPPFFSDSTIIHGDDEIKEAFYCYSHLRCTEQLWDYEGKEVTINDNRGVCSHAAYCSNGLPSVWTFGKEPWIDPDGADGEKIIKQIKKCPSGALSYTLKGERYQNLEREPKIIVSKNGPYYIQGSIKLADNIGSKPEAEEHFSLCRCGASKNKPFCDGSHWKIKFNDLKN